MSEDLHASYQARISDLVVQLERAESQRDVAQLQVKRLTETATTNAGRMDQLRQRTTEELTIMLMSAERDRNSARERVGVLEAALSNLRAFVPAGMTMQVTHSRELHSVLYGIQFGVYKELLDGSNPKAFDIVEEIGRDWFRKLLDAQAEEESR